MGFCRLSIGTEIVDSATERLTHAAGWWVPPCRGLVGATERLTHAAGWWAPHCQSDALYCFNCSNAFTPNAIWDLDGKKRRIWEEKCK